MKSAIVLILALAASLAAQATRNDPAGVWQSESGTKFEISINGSDLQVHLVKGSNPVYVSYDVALKNMGEVNTYEGGGVFVAKLKDRECRFDTVWKIIVVQTKTIAGYFTHVVPDAATCEVKERRDEFVQLKKVE